ncbi:phage baseplate assembly protein V [Nocardia sp. NPDC050712]|uniref:phage baseplate assembly protein V n=1 Tax=Nocardia sp. NPDC050712 TaxID=3155518 RepID=UPI0033D4EE99
MLTEELGRHAGRYYGKYRGKVADDADPDCRGTLEVTVPAVFGTTASVPAAPCLPYGYFFVPPKGTDVWVEFEAGDTRRPVWTGVWYPQGATPPEAAADPPERRVIKTVAGHTVEIVDTPGAEQILIHHASDAFVSIDAHGSVLVADGKGSHLHLDAENGKTTLVEAHGNHLSMTADGTAVVNPKGTVLNLVEDTVHVNAKTVVLNATSVALGTNAAEPTLMGTAFSALWHAMLTHTHVVTGTLTPPAAVAGVAAPSLQLAPLLLQPGVHLSSAVVVK